MNKQFLHAQSHRHNDPHIHISIHHHHFTSIITQEPTNQTPYKLMICSIKETNTPSQILYKTQRPCV